MSTMLAPLVVEEPIVYPESDGLPMADNTAQFDAIVKFKENIALAFEDDPDVLVVGDLLWYPVQGNPKICCAPDVMIVFGRPKGYRGSYLQWREDNIPPQVVFEILSPSNTQKEMDHKFRFYETYGVEEYYLYDPERNDLWGWQRNGTTLQPIPSMYQWISPRLQIRFEHTRDDLTLYGPNDERFLTFSEFKKLAMQERREKEQAKQEAERAKQEVEQERTLRKQAEQQAEQSRQQAEQSRQHAEKLAAFLRQMGIDPETHFEQN